MEEERERKEDEEVRCLEKRDGCGRGERDETKYVMGKLSEK